MNNEIATINHTSTDVSFIDIRSNQEKFPRLCQYNREEATFHMAKIVTQAFMYRNQPTDNTTIQFISSSLVDELMQEERYGARYISFAEISKVVKRAVLGDSEMFGVSVASLYKVIMDYVKGEGHRADAEAKRLTQEQRRKQLQQSAMQPMIDALANQLTKNK